MNSKFHVSLEAARLLKEKGYDRECISYYHDNCREVDYSFCGERNSTWEERCVSAPTKAEAIDWLESKGMVIDVRYDNDELQKDDSEWVYYIYQYDNEGRLDEIVSGWVTDGIFDTRLAAEEAAIIKALELL